MNPNNNPTRLFQNVDADNKHNVRLRAVQTEVDTNSLTSAAVPVSDLHLWSSISSVRIL